MCIPSDANAGDIQNKVRRVAVSRANDGVGNASEELSPPAYMR